MVSVEPAPSKRILDDVRESAAARHTVRELADLWRSARAEIKAAKADAAGWKILAVRAGARPVPGEVKAEIARLDAPPPDGTDGPTRRAAAANDTATAEVASCRPRARTALWRSLRPMMATREKRSSAHVAKIGNILRRSRNLRAAQPRRDVESVAHARSPRLRGTALTAPERDL